MSKSVWFKFTFANGRFVWVHSPKGFVGLIPVITTVPADMCNGTTIRSASPMESVRCSIRKYLYRDPMYVEVTE